MTRHDLAGKLSRLAAIIIMAKFVESVLGLLIKIRDLIRAGAKEAREKSATPVNPPSSVPGCHCDHFQY